MFVWIFSGQIARLPSSPPISSSSHFFFIQPLLHPTSLSSNLSFIQLFFIHLFLMDLPLCKRARQSPKEFSSLVFSLRPPSVSSLSVLPLPVRPACSFHSHLHPDCSLDFRTTFDCGYTLLSQTFFQTRRVWRHSRKLDIITSPTVRPGQRKPRNPRLTPSKARSLAQRPTAPTTLRRLYRRCIHGVSGFWKDVMRVL